MKTKGKEVINNIQEKFIQVGVKYVDSKNRMNLGEKVIRIVNKITNADAFEVFVGNEGDILLRPAVNIPSREAWVYRNPKVLAQVRNGLAEAKEGKTEKVDDLDKFLENL
ncbi:MAG: hypothetical protein ABH952_04275 [Candidatus Omnitrophota bacterium]